MSSAQPHQGRVQGDLARKSWLEQLYKQEAVSRPNPPDASNGGNSAGLKSIKTRKIWQSVPAALSSKSKSLPAAAAAALPLATPAASAAVAAAAAAAATVYAAAIDRGDKLEPVAKAMAAAAIKASASASNAAKAGKARIAAVAAEAATVCSVAARALAGYSAPLEAEAKAAAAVAAAETAVAAGGSTAVVQRVAEDAFTPFLGLGKTLKRVMVSAADRVKESSGESHTHAHLPIPPRRFICHAPPFCLDMLKGLLFSSQTCLPTCVSLNVFSPRLLSTASLHLSSHCVPQFVTSRAGGLVG